MTGRPTTFSPELGEVFIYALCDPDTGQIRYVGKATSPRKRYAGHLRYSRRKNTPVYSWIRKLMLNGKLPTMVILESVMMDDWPQAERRHIALHRKSSVLLNIADGGNEPYCSAEVRTRNGIANAKRRNTDPRMKRLNHLKLQLGIALQQGFVNEKTKERMRQAAMNRPDLFGKWAAI